MLHYKWPLEDVRDEHMTSFAAIEVLSHVAYKTHTKAQKCLITEQQR